MVRSREYAVATMQQPRQKDKLLFFNYLYLKHKGKSSVCELSLYANGRFYVQDAAVFLHLNAPRAVVVSPLRGCWGFRYSFSIIISPLRGCGGFIFFLFLLLPKNQIRYCRCSVEKNGEVGQVFILKLVFKTDSERCFFEIYGLRAVLLVEIQADTADG